MSPLAPILSLSLVSALAIGCGNQSYTPISEDNLDELCRQSTVALSESSSAAIELDASGQAHYDGSLDVRLFSKAEMRVDTEELIFSIPGGKIATVSAGEGTWDLFSNIVFAVDVRSPGTSEWQQISLTTSAYDIFWFTDLEFNGSTDVLAATTLSLCDSSKRDASNLPVSFDIQSDYEMRVRAFPFDGLGDLVGTYDYRIDVAVY